MSNRIFQSTSILSPKKSMFDLSSDRKLTLNMGGLYPIGLWECIPGDTFRINSELFLRFAPLINPVMHRCNAYVHFYKVPYRLLWDEWEDHYTGGRKGDLNPPVPKVSIDGDPQSFSIEKGSLGDYLGLPLMRETIQSGAIDISLLPFRAYWKIWNDYYRDQDTQEEIDVKTLGDIPDVQDWQTKINVIAPRAWEKDYFTSASTSPQLGDPMRVPITLVNRNPAFASTDGTTPQGGDLQSQAGGGVQAGGVNVQLTTFDANESESATIPELRKAFKIQELLELAQRAGTRYVEQIMAHFGVRSSDARLQRAEYLGGGRQPVMISEVLRTASEGATTAVGDLHGHGISVGNQNGMKTFCEEHCYIMPILSVMPRTVYMDGVEKLWTKFDRYDHYLPSLAHVGEMEIKNKEVKVTRGPAGWDNEGTWGYQQQYAEYKYSKSQVCGDFRDNQKQWTLARDFGEDNVGVPLNEDFIKSDPSKRIFAVTDPDVDSLQCEIFHNVRASRPIPYFTDPRTW